MILFNHNFATIFLGETQMIIFMCINLYSSAKYSAQMAVCLDCKTMVLQEIKTSRVNRSNLLRHLTLDLSSVY